MNDNGSSPSKRAGKAVTVTDIARAIGVSRATVSLVLRGSPLVNVDTRAKVEAELRRQRYVYNRAAANLRRRTSSSIALVINDLSNPFFAEFASGVDEALGGRGYVTLLGSTGESPERQQAVLSTLMEHTPAGLILSPAEGSDTVQLRQALGANANVLLFNRELEGADWDFLTLDNQHGAYLATRHLIERGHRQIAFFGGHAASSSCHQRRAGFQQALAEAGLSLPPGWMIESAPNRLEAAARTDELFADGHRPSAAVCYNDTVALGLMLVAVTVSATIITVGAIPFVGLVVPNLVALHYGDNLSRTLPVVALGGASLLLVCDILGRVLIYPFEVPIGLTAGGVGGVLFLALIFWKHR
ncbi:iron chelate uptake ABC transporter family permease subunit [Achromobacter sp. UBA5777]|nr:iron chelate uptake ABC transporter family permease subunit [Achromobacter sp. UBA5777]